MIPEYWTAGIMVMRAVPKMAATWLLMKLEIRSPIPVAMMT